MKRKLLLAALCVVGALGMRAQTDVTATYLTNANFASGTPIDNNVCTYGKDMATNSTTYYGAQAIEGWTNASVGETDSGYENSKLAGALFAYGSTPWIGGTGTPAPATDPEGNAGNAAGLCAVWGGSVQYTQAVTLPAGSYTVVFKVYNATSGSGNSSGVITTDLFGFVEDGGTTHYAPNNTFAIGQWSTIAVTFNLAAETEGKISMGYTGPSGNAAMPHLFVDNVKILRNVMTKDVTDKVNKTGWTGAGDGYQGGTINTARQYGDKSVGRHIYQTVSGLDNGTYEVALYAISQKEWNGSLASDAGDVAYVFAEGAYELKEWINARSRSTYPGDDNLGIYTISGVQVTDGTLTIGMGLAQADLTEWHHVQIKSLVRTYIDLTELITAYNNALTAAKAVDQTKNMAASVKTALNNAIATYDTGNVDTENGEALQAAADALNAATNNANTSIASYAIIANGSIPDNSLDGWVCENSNTFQINTWSTEGNNDGSNMKTPFIQNWVAKGSYLGAGKVYYQLAGLEPGEVYYAQALVRSYNEANSDAPNGPNFFINDVVTSLSEAGTTFTFNGMSGIYATLGGVATVGEDGILKLGVEIAADRNYNWVAFKNVSIQSMDAAFNAAVAKVTALDGTIPTAVYNNAYAVVTANSGDNYPTTASGFEAAIAAIEAAATSAAAMQKPYAKWNTQKAIVEHNVAASTNNESARTTLSEALSTQSAAIENATTVEGIDNVISALKTANNDYVQVATPTTKGDYIDCTTMLTNPDVTELSGAAGWQTEQEGGNFGVTTNAHREGYTIAYSIEYWSATAQANNKFSLYDEITLPEGTYEMSCYAFASPNGVEGATNNAVYFYANDTQGSLISSTDLEEATLSFVNASEQAVKIGLKTLTGNQYRWMGIGYVSLHKVPANAVTIDEDEDYTPESVAATVTLKRAIKADTWNTFIVPFQINNTELKAAFGEDVAIAEFSDAGENEDAVTISFNTMETPAISPNKPVLLKTSTTGSEYTFEGRTIATGETKVAGTYIDFVGTYAASTTVAEGDYFIGSNKLYKSAGATTIKGTRAYLHVKAAGVKVRMVIDDEATAIDAIEIANTAQNGKIYDLSGRLVKNPVKGLYIQNGKKYLVK